MEILKSCPECSTEPGQIHIDGCDIEICSACGTQRLQCDCKDHDPAFARWSGVWPGKAEAEYLGMDLNEFCTSVSKLFFIKPNDN